MGSNSPYTGEEIRKEFLEYFKRHDHQIVSSSPLVPKDDPTLLFTNAGMVQFKDIFLGRRAPEHPRATTVQKCVRAGGKHNDLENVGKTPRHHTFFEMLGNFSFGDYFKKEAVNYAWEFLVDVLGIDPKKLWITVFLDDDEAAHLWRHEVDIPAYRIVRLDETDNFWSMGDVGPCGPCSEIIYDRGQRHRCDADECAIGKCDCGRWLELWNLVFMQYQRDESGDMTPLEDTGVDTGLGLERIASVIQEVPSNYDTDLFTPLFSQIQQVVDKDYQGGNSDADLAFRVIADHVRACTFLIGDGVFPSNEGRGYVLRRILRRAARFGVDLDHSEPLLHRLVPTVVREMGDTYPELREREDFIRQTIKREEERFGRTLQQGLDILLETIGEVRERGDKEIAAGQVFRLYDTYGFPVDLCEDVAEKHGMTVDRQGFENLMQKQRQRARRAQKSEGQMVGSDDIGRQVEDVAPTHFVGYRQQEVSARVTALLKEDGVRIGSASADNEVGLLLSRTPFYAESGGQVGDAGRIWGDDFTVEVVDVVQVSNRHHLHRGQVKRGTVSEGDEVVAAINSERRTATARNHTATHLLHAVLREVLGDHVRQSGSLVASDRLRFDFSHHSPLTIEEMHTIEDRVNQIILEGREVSAEMTEYQTAIEEGALALFGERYSSDQVRVVRVPGVSAELCGGTHVDSTCNIGSFKLTDEGSIGSGMRRVEAVTGCQAVSWMQRQEQLLRRLADDMDASVHQLPDRIEELQGQLKQLRRKNQQQQDQMLQMQVDTLVGKAENHHGIALLAETVQAEGAEQLRHLADSLRGKLPESALLVACSTGEESVVVIGAAAEEAVERGVNMGEVVSEIGGLLGGGGGGRPDMAQAGGSRPDRLTSALDEGMRLLKRNIVCQME